MNQWTSWLIVFGIIALTVFILANFIKQKPDKEQKRFKKALSSQTNEELENALKEILLAPYQLPLMSHLAPDLPEDHEGLYNYFLYNYCEGYKVRAKKTTSYKNAFLHKNVFVLILFLFLIVLLVLDWSWFLCSLTIFLAFSHFIIIPILVRISEDKKEAMDKIEKKIRDSLEKMKVSREPTES